jgi:hypothetical protein
MSLRKQERLDEFVRRLAALPAARSHDEARRLIEVTLNQVEDELSGVPYDPGRWRTDGRMYPVQDDHAADVDGHPSVTSYRSRRHDTFIAANGAFEIHDLSTGGILIRKLGADGRGVWS